MGLSHTPPPQIYYCMLLHHGGGGLIAHWRLGLTSWVVRGERFHPKRLGLTTRLGLTGAGQGCPASDAVNPDRRGLIDEA
jgi:hypothetical protein